jgi:hypothetical protein
MANMEHPRNWQWQITPHSIRPPPKKPQPRAALLRCPPEIRNAFYEELLQGSHSIFLKSQSYHSHLVRFIEGINLLATCRQIHLEASGVLYSGNTFVAEYDFYKLEQWIQNIGNSRILLRSLHVDLDRFLLQCRMQ